MAWFAGNLYAIAQRGNFAVNPSSRRCAKESTLITSPSASYGSLLLRSAHAVTAAASASPSLHQRDVGRGREAERAQPQQALRVQRAKRLAGHQLVEQRLQRPARALARVEQLERAAGEVARVLPQLLAGLLALLVDRGEVALVHVDLAAHGDGHRLGERQRQRAQRAQVDRDVLADAPVAAGRALDEATRRRIAARC